MTKFTTTANEPVSRGKTMKRRLISSLLTAACVAAPLSLLPQAAHAQTVQRPATDMAISIGRGQLVTVPGRLADVFVADEKIADVQVKSASQIYVFGKSGGETTVYASNAAGQVIWSANVRVGSNIDSVDQMLRLAMPDANITVSTMNNMVLLTGTIAAPEDAAEAQRLVQAYVGATTNVVSRLRMATPLQVNLQVRIAEVSRSFVRDVGVNLSTIDNSSGFQFGLGQAGRTFSSPYIPNTALPGNPINGALGNGAGATSVTIPDPANPGRYLSVPTTSVSPIAIGSTIAGAGRLLGLNLLAALDLGETMGLVTTLSNPNLTALSGETADFLAGGEFPVPISQGLGSTSIEYRKYGVSLAYTPTVLANGRISLRVRPEVSELSSQGAVVLNGFSVPALTIRRAETTVELGSGQSFMIAGLMSNSSQNLLKKTPGAGDLPVIGALFRSTNFRKGETELVIVVTPYLVNPVNGNEIKLPTDGFQSPNMLQQMLGNMDNDGRSGVARPVPHAAPDAAATGPTVGALAAPATTVLTPPAGAVQAHSRDPHAVPRTASAAGAAPAPGFTLN